MRGGATGKKQKNAGLLPALMPPSRWGLGKACSDACGPHQTGWPTLSANAPIMLPAGRVGVWCSKVSAGTRCLSRQGLPRHGPGCSTPPSSPPPRTRMAAHSSAPHPTCASRTWGRVLADVGLHSAVWVGAAAELGGGLPHDLCKVAGVFAKGGGGVVIGADLYGVWGDAGGVTRAGLWKCWGGGGVGGAVTGAFSARCEPAGGARSCPVAAYTRRVSRAVHTGGQTAPSSFPPHHPTR